MDPATPLPPPITDLEAQQILWRLSELNFRFELLALNKHAGPPGHDAFERDQAVRNALLITSLQVVDMDMNLLEDHACLHRPLYYSPV